MNEEIGSIAGLIITSVIVLPVIILFIGLCVIITKELWEIIKK